MKNKTLEDLLERVKRNLETLEVQLNLGSKEARDTFEKKRDELNQNIEKVREHAKEMGKEGSVHLEKLENEGKSLIDLLNADYDFSYKEFDSAEAHTKNMKENLEDLYKDAGKELKKEAKERYSHLLEKMEMEFSVQKAYADKKGEDLEKWRDNLKKEVSEVKEKIDKNKDVAEERFEHFTAELKEAFEHIKKAFSSLKK